MTRTEFKSRCRAAGVYAWQVAESYGCTEFTLSRMLRHPVEGEKEERLIAAIEQAAEEANADD